MKYTVLARIVSLEVGAMRLDETGNTIQLYSCMDGIQPCVNTWCYSTFVLKFDSLSR